VATPLNISGDLLGLVTFTPEEHPDDRAMRLKTEARRELMHDWKETVLFGVLLIGIVMVGIVAADAGLWDGSASAETKRWGQTILSAVVTRGISFVAGRKIGGR
jgi:hypothetical protein